MMERAIQVKKDAYRPEVSDVSEDEISSNVGDGGKSENVSSCRNLTSVLDIKGPSHKRRCDGQLSIEGGKKIHMNPARIEAQMMELSKMRWVGCL